MPYEIGFTDLGRTSLKSLDKDLRRDIVRELAPLVDQPYQSTELKGSLKGIWSLHVQKDYRVLYRIEDESKRVYIEFVGERKKGSEEDVYARAKHLLTKLLDHHSDER